MNVRDEWVKSARLSIVSENYIFCDCDEGCENCQEESEIWEEPWNEED